MNMHNRNIAFFVGEEAPIDLLDDLRGELGMSVQAFDSTLPHAHDGAAAAALENNVILFRAQGDVQMDIGAVKSLREAAGQAIVILALSAADTSLEQARRLTVAGL